MMQAYTTSPQCGTSRYSSITGRYASRAVSARSEERSGRGDGNGDGVVNVAIPTVKLEEKDCTEDNIVVALKASGYRTGMVGKWHLSRTDYDTYNYLEAVGAVKQCGFDFVDALYVENMQANPDQFDSYSDGSFSHNMEFVTHEAIRFINDDNDADKPFFLYVNPTVPHSSQAVDTALKNFTCQDTPRKDVTSDFIIKGMTGDFGGSCEAYRANVMSRANSTADLGSIWLDDSVGAILQALIDNDILDNTLFIFQHDHGIESKAMLYENGVRIAQFVHYPARIPAGSKYDNPVSTIDIAATLLDFAEVEALPYAMDGKSWRSGVEEGASNNLNDYNRCLFFEQERDRAVRCGCDKLVIIGQEDGSTAFTRGDSFGYSIASTNLFDLCGGTGAYVTSNSQESNQLNLIDTNPDKASEMEKVLNCHSERISNLAESGNFTSCELNTIPSKSLLSESSESTGHSVSWSRIYIFTTIFAVVINIYLF